MRIISQTDSSGFIRIGDKVQIRPRGKRGIYVAEFFHAGHHRRRSLKTARLDIARKRGIKLEADLAGGEYKARPCPMGLLEAQEQFIALKTGEAKKPKTIVKYREWVSRFESFAAANDVRYLQQVTPELFEKFRTDLCNTQSPKSLYTGLVIVKSFFKFFSGGTRDVLTINPVARCKVNEPYVAPKFTPTLPQVNAILAAATGDRLLQYAVAAFSGVREEELAMLATSSVDLQGKWIHIVARDGWTPKTGRARKVPIHPRLAQILAGVATTARPYYFCAPASKRYPAGDHHMNVRQVNEDIQAVAKGLGIPVGRKNNGLVFHSLRHYFETQCVDSGIPQFVIDAWTGHVGEESTGRTYYGLTDAKSQAYMTQVKF
jgi:integrase